MNDAIGRTNLPRKAENQEEEVNFYAEDDEMQLDSILKNVAILTSRHSTGDSA